MRAIKRCTHAICEDADLARKADAGSDSSNNTACDDADDARKLASQLDCGGLSTK